MSDNAQSNAAHHYETPEVHEILPDSLDYLSPAQRRDLRAIEAPAYYSGDDFADGLTLDYGRVI